MTAASSISTYLDVAQAAGGGLSPEPTTRDTESMERSAKVLAAIFKGTVQATDLPEKTGLTFDQVFKALNWLSESELIELEESDGNVIARVADPLKTVLDKA